jgi:hypothetical protein
MIQLDPFDDAPRDEGVSACAPRPEETATK